jgi:PQQ-dependent catabolism-associated CXXCW motif protein
MSTRTASWLQAHGRLWYDDGWYRAAWIVGPQALAMLVLLGWLSWIQSSVQWGKPTQGPVAQPTEQVDALGPCTSAADNNQRISACSDAIASGKLRGDDLAQAYYQRATSYAALGQFQLAVNDANQAIALVPDNAFFLNERGIAFMGLGNNDAALRDFNQAVALKPDFALAHANRAWVLVAQQRPDEAITAATTAINLDPNLAWAYQHRAAAHEAKKEWRPVYDDATKLIELSPNDRMGYALRGHAYFEAGQYQPAIADFNKAISFDSTNVFDYRTRGRAYYFLNRFDDARADYEAALRIDPKDELTLSYLNDLKRRQAASASPPGPQPSDNFSNELTDWNVPPQSELQTNIGSETPSSIPGGRRVVTAEVLKLINTEAVLIDVLRDNTGGHRTIPGAIYIPGAGDAGNFRDHIQRRLAQVLAQLTSQDANRELVFFCLGAECWESYNAALRAIQLGYRNVLWYRGGLQSWNAAKLPLQAAAGYRDVLN